MVAIGYPPMIRRQKTTKYVIYDDIVVSLLDQKPLVSQFSMWETFLPLNTWGIIQIAEQIDEYIYMAIRS